MDTKSENKIIEEKEASIRFKKHKQFHQIDDIDKNKKEVKKEVVKQETRNHYTFAFDLNDY